MKKKIFLAHFFQLAGTIYGFIPRQSKQLILLSVLITGFNSCNLRNRFVYLNNYTGNPNAIRTSTSPTIQPGDRLEIKIAGLEPQSSLPFYFSTGVNMQASNETPPNTYMVNSDGRIAIPVLGEITVGGLNLEVAETQIRDKLKDVIKSPVVTIRIFNFMISVLGEVKNPGYIRIQNNRVTIMELIAMAGDITLSGDRKEVVVWRREGNEIKPYTIDLTSTTLFQSPVYELKQGDMVYVKPNKSGLFQPTLIRNAGPVILSLASIILTTYVLFVR